VILEKGDPTKKRGKVVRLSPLGLKVQHSYYRLIEEIENEWMQRFGADRVRELRASLTNLTIKRKGDESILGLGLVPPAGVARAGAIIPALGRRDVGAAARQRTKDLVDQTQRFLSDPENSLPHFPVWDMNRGFGP